MKKKQNMKNAKVPNNPDIRQHKGWDLSKAPWHGMTFGKYEVIRGEHAFPGSPKKPGDTRNQSNNGVAV